MKFDNKTKTLSITAGELLALQLENVVHYDSEDYFCIILQEVMQNSFNRVRIPRSSFQVIDEFRKVIPKRFKTKDEESCLLDDHLLAKYSKVVNPRIWLLKAIPPEHEFSFEMV